MAAPTNPIPSITPRDANNVPAFFASGVKVISGTKTSTTPGTPVALVTASTPCHHVVISAYLNAGFVALGDSVNTLAEPNTNNKTGLGQQLMSGASTTFYVVDASLIYLDVANSGDGVAYTIFA